MEVASPPQQQLLGDSFSRGWLTKRGAREPSLERLSVLGHSFGSSRSFSFIDMDPAELFSMRWTTTATAPPESDFDFGLIPGGGGGGSGYGQGAGGGGGYSRPPAAAPRAPAARPAPAPAKSSSGFDDMDDDIPF